MQAGFSLNIVARNVKDGTRRKGSMAIKDVIDGVLAPINEPQGGKGKRSEVVVQVSGITGTRVAFYEGCMRGID